MKLHGKAKREFLARMARGRKKAGARPARKHKHRKRHHATRHHAHPPHHPKKHHTMAKKRRHRGKKKGTRRSSGGSRARSLLNRLRPTTDEVISAGSAALYGYAEGAASKEQDHFLNKVPVPIASIGRSGTIGVGAYLLGALSGRRFIRSMARGIVDVASYQIFRRPTKFGAAGDTDVDFKLGASSYPYPASVRARTPALVESHLQADLDDDSDDD